MEETNSETNPLIMAELEKAIKLAYLPTTSGELIEYFAKKGIATSDNTIRRYLQVLEETSQISVSRTQGQRDNLILWQQDPNFSYLNLKILGISLQVSESQGIFVATGLINFYDLGKICGIHPYKPLSSDKLGVQRPRKDDWIIKLEEKITQKYSQMASSAIIYFDSDVVEIYNELDEKIGQHDLTYKQITQLKLNVRYHKYSFDEDKPGQILDGQQRIWALEHARILKVFSGECSEGDLSLIGPVTFIIGDFEDEDEKSSTIRRLFINANTTRPLPEYLQRQLAVTVTPEQTILLPNKIQNQRIVETIIMRLNNEKYSPFFDLIELTNDRLNRNMTPKFTHKAIIGIVTDLLKNPIMAKLIDSIDLENSVDFKNNLEIIIDYFNIIKSVFEDSWNDINLSKLRSYLVLMAFAQIPNYFITISDVINREVRIKKITQEMLRLKQGTEFQSNEPFLLRKTYKKSDISEMAELIKKLHAQNVRYIPLETETQRIINTVNNLKL